MGARTPVSGEQHPAPCSNGTGAATDHAAAQPPLSGAFWIDLRSLAAFRILVSLVLLWDLVLRSRDLEAHYTDHGVLPRTVLIDTYLSLRPYLSLHIVHGSAFFEAVLFGVAGLCAAALLVGYRTSGAAVACWFLTTSLHARNPLVVHGGDDLLRVLLFWAMFVPLGGCWSIDRARASEIDSSDRFVCSWGTAGLMLQLCFMYLFSGILKHHPSWRSEGTAVFLALSIEQFATPIGRALLPYHGLLMALTFSTLAMELAGPIVAIFSFDNIRLRTLVVFGFMLFHVGLGLCLELGIFPAVCIAGWILYLPGEVWDRLERRLTPHLAHWQRRIPGPIVAFVLQRMSRVSLRPVRLHRSRTVNVVAGVYLVYIFLWNVRTCDFQRFERVFPQSLNIIGEVTRVDQYWNLFAPYPSLEHGWYVVDAHLRDGDEIDLLTGKPVTWEKPPLVSATYTNERWRKYLMNLSTGQYASHRPYYAQYLHNVWNDSHPAAKKLATMEIYFVSETALPHYRVSPRQHLRLWTQQWSP